jgi:2-keto-3-deoxy-L-rhamnonate aldolase RhmA
VHALLCGFGSVRNYREIANDSIATLAMIETRKAIDNLHKIVAVKGLDAVFIGTFIVNLRSGSRTRPVIRSLPCGTFAYNSPMHVLSTDTAGPNDLALSLGIPPSSDPTNPEILEVIT